MRTTITVDDELWDRARQSTGIRESSELVRTALREMVAREAGRRLLAMGGTDPDAWIPGRGRSDDWTPER